MRSVWAFIIMESACSFCFKHDFRLLVGQENGQVQVRLECTFSSISPYGGLKHAVNVCKLIICVPKRSFWYMMLDTLCWSNEDKPPHGADKSRESPEPLQLGELTFVSTTHVDLIRPPSAMVRCDALMNAVSLSVHNHGVCLLILF